MYPNSVDSSPYRCIQAKQEIKIMGFHKIDHSSMIFRKAQITDASQMLRVRNSVNENKLSDPNSITGKDCEDFLIEKGKGWVCEINNEIVGFCMLSLEDNSVWALFVNPIREGLGIGRRLHDLMVNWYFDQSKDTLWLGTSPNTRAEKFYKKSGWTEVGKHGVDEIKFEMTFENWRN